MERAEIFEMFGPILQQGQRRRRLTDYAALALLVIVIALIVYGSWQNRRVPKIESIDLIANSIVVIGPAANINEQGRMYFCPGDTMTVRYQLAIEGDGVIYADDAAHYNRQTVKFSDTWRDIVETGARTYEDEWLIPQRPDMPVDGQRVWLPGEYRRVISVSASNIYISRYVPPATFETPFLIGEDCL